MLRSFFAAVHRRCRARRAELFRRYLEPSPDDRILDLGGGYGDFFATIVPFRSNVWIADIDPRILQRAERHGFQTALIPADGSLPFADGFFDIVHCNSVIEHVVIPEHRFRLASEIRRVGKRWFVQTPNRHFPLEPHTRMPFAQWLPQSWLRSWLPYMGRIWGYTDDLGWRLLDSHELMELFPGGRLVRERWAGLTKSLVVIGSQTDPFSSVSEAIPAFFAGKSGPNVV
jgi:ubiquinone/menaquinone biosynthesis C-methylase UbiE